MSPLLGIWASSIQGSKATAFDSIATTTVGAGGQTSITFSSIPSTYKHLQLRGLIRSARSGTDDYLAIRANGDSGNNYANHSLRGNGSTAQALQGTSQNYWFPSWDFPGNTSTSNTFGGMVIDILDYSNTNKNKTFRILCGGDMNGSGQAAFASGLWASTSAITSLSLEGAYAFGFTQYSTFALYGIK